MSEQRVYKTYENNNSEILRTEKPRMIEWKERKRKKKTKERGVINFDKSVENLLELLNT